MCKNEKSTQSHTRIQSKNADSLHEKKSSWTVSVTLNAKITYFQFEIPIKIDWSMPIFQHVYFAWTSLGARVVAA